MSGVMHKIGDALHIGGGHKEEKEHEQQQQPHLPEARDQPQYGRGGTDGDEYKEGSLMDKMDVNVHGEPRHHDKPQGLDHYPKHSDAQNDNYQEQPRHNYGDVQSQGFGGGGDGVYDNKPATGLGAGGNQYKDEGLDHYPKHGGAQSDSYEGPPRPNYGDGQSQGFGGGAAGGGQYQGVRGDQYKDEGVIDNTQGGGLQRHRHDGGDYNKPVVGAGAGQYDQEGGLSENIYGAQPQGRHDGEDYSNPDDDHRKVGMMDKIKGKVCGGGGGGAVRDDYE